MDRSVSRFLLPESDLPIATAPLARKPHLRNAEATRIRILEAARLAFSFKGYGDVGVREIAAAADCDPALIRRYCGSKEKLFEQVLALALNVSFMVDGPRAGFGQRVVENFLYRQPFNSGALPILILSTSDPASRAIALRLFEDHVIARVATWLGNNNAAERAARIVVLSSGYFLFARILPLSVLKTASPDNTHEWLARMLQAIVDEPN